MLLSAAASQEVSDMTRGGSPEFAPSPQWQHLPPYAVSYFFAFSMIWVSHKYNLTAKSNKTETRACIMTPFGLGKPSIEKMILDRNVDGLAQVLEFDKDANKREKAAKALGNIGSKKAIDSLAGAFYDNDQTVRIEAAQSLVKIGGQLVVDKMTAAVKDLPQLFKSDASQKLAVETIGKIGTAQAIESLITLLEEGPSVTLRGYAVTELERIAGPRAIEALFVAYNGQNDAGVFAWQALERIGGQSVADFLLKALKSPDGKTREDALSLLLHIRNPSDVLGLLLDILDDPDPNVRARAAKALGDPADREIVERLIVCLKDQSPVVRKAAAEALGGKNYRNAIDGLIGAAKDADKHVSETALEALKKSSDPEAVKAVYSLDSSWGQYSISMEPPLTAEPYMGATVKRSSKGKSDRCERCGKKILSTSEFYDRCEKAGMWVDRSTGHVGTDGELVAHTGTMGDFLSMAEKRKQESQSLKDLHFRLSGERGIKCLNCTSIYCVECILENGRPLPNGGKGCMNCGGRFEALP